MDDQLSSWARHVSLAGLGFAILMLLAESWWPHARSGMAFGRRWVANLVTYLSIVMLFRWLPQLSLLGAALLAQQNGWGLFNELAAPGLVAIAISWLAVDLSGYLVHRLEHRIPLLWRIHRLHHSDPDVDVTTTYRFHPLEVLLRSGVSSLVVVGLGMPPVAALGYLLLSALTSVLSHANVRLPLIVDRAIGMVVITGNIHRTHHSIDLDDLNSNFSVCLSCWDRLFGTFRSNPTLGYENINFGVTGRTAEDGTSILRMLADPFLPERRSEVVGYADSSRLGDPEPDIVLPGSP